MGFVLRLLFGANKDRLRLPTEPSEAGKARSESSPSIVVPATAPIPDLLALAADKDCHVDQEIAEEDCEVVPAKLVASAGLWHVIREAHQAVVQHNDGALVEDLHLGGEGGLEWPHVHQVDQHGGGESELNRKLYPQVVPDQEDADDKGDSTGEEECRIEENPLGLLFLAVNSCPVKECSVG